MVITSRTDVGLGRATGRVPVGGLMFRPAAGCFPQRDRIGPPLSSACAAGACHMGTMGEYVVLRALQCRACQSQFFICIHCYRGQCYCGPQCRARSRRQQLRAANARYQQSEPGRLDHNDRQHAYRERRRTRSAAPPVTYQSSLEPDSAPSCCHDAVSPLPPGRSRPSGCAGPTLRCPVCRRPGFTAAFCGLLAGLCRLVSGRLRLSGTP